MNNDLQVALHSIPIEKFVTVSSGKPHLLYKNPIIAGQKFSPCIWPSNGRGKLNYLPQK